jgi:hypothetical protein
MREGLAPLPFLFRHMTSVKKRFLSVKKKIIVDEERE